MNETVDVKENILYSIKHAIGVDDPSYTPFDPDIIMLINSTINILDQLGISSDTSGFTIEDGTENWTDYIADMSKLQMVKEYITLKVRLVFDPPASASVINVITEELKMLEFRLNIQVDPGLPD